MPAAPPVPTAPVEEETPQRSGRLLIILGALAAVSAVIAGLVIFSSGTTTRPPKEPVAQVAARDHVLVVGRPTAPTKVVVYEDFASPESRTFEISSRDFLEDEAAQGDVVVEYHPVSLAGDDYSASALAAWGVVAERGRPRQALALHDLVFDRQPDPDEATAPDFIALAKKAGVTDSEVLEGVGAPDRAWLATVRRTAASAGVRTTPVVRVDGEPLSAGTPVALADRLQRQVLKAADTP